MTISTSPEAATGDVRVSNLTESHLLNDRIGRRRAAKTLVASGLAFALGTSVLRTAGAQDAEAPPAGTDDWTGEDGSGTDWSDDTSTDTATESTSTDTTTTTEAASGSGSGSGNGQAIADFALQYVGLPYAAAGRDPSVGFDCSGFTWYVISNVLGIDIGGSPEGQVGYGAAVEYGAWQPGDLVFFANTFREGISHVGIAIGGSQMVHAENESTGVTISDITSEYYTSHYASAIRF